MLGAITIVYTLVGGAKSVIWNDCIQFAVYMVGAAAALAVIVNGLPGGWDGLDLTGPRGALWEISTHGAASLDPLTPGNHAFYLGTPDFDTGLPDDPSGGFGNRQPLTYCGFGGRSLTCPTDDSTTKSSPR